MTQRTFDGDTKVRNNMGLDPWELLLEKTKTIKDPVHGDIHITQTELEIIDTGLCQRLRFIRQLGPAYLVYPSAQHSRFEHMLGTLFMAQSIIDSVNMNLTKSEQIDAKDMFTIRLVALLHDFAHLPFGHTLEDEGRLFEGKQWESELRQKLLFDPNAQKIESSIKAAFSACNRDAEAKAEANDVLTKIRSALIQEESGEAEDLPFPYIADVVGNTICADLLDYLKRDVYFTGLSGDYDKRVLSYFTLMNVKNSKGVLKKRLVIKLFKNGKHTNVHHRSRRREIRHDVLSGLLDMLRLRYSLAERVYFHHAKREASAMVIKMVAAAMRAGFIDERTLCSLDDVSLFSFIETFDQREDAKDLSETQRCHLAVSKKLAERLRRRELYKPAYELKILEAPTKARVDELIQDWEMRVDFEERIASELGLKPEDIIVYIPREEMGAKTAKTLVQLPFDGDGSICTVEKLGRTNLPADYRDEHDVVGEELKALETRHRMLWKLSVFVHPDVQGEKVGSIKRICQDWFEHSDQYTLVNIKADASGVSLTPDESMKIAAKAADVVAAPGPRAHHQSSFSRVCDTIEALLGSKK